MIPNRLEHSIPVVYQITNVINGKIYVGSTKNFYERYREYVRFRGDNRTSKRGIEHAMRKWGFDYFVFSVLEVADGASTETLVAREQYYLDTLLPFHRKGYNMCSKAYSCAGRETTEETRRKQSIAHRGYKPTPETMAKIIAATIGLKRTEETR